MIVVIKINLDTGEAEKLETIYNLIAIHPVAVGPTASTEAGRTKGLTVVDLANKPMREAILNGLLHAREPGSDVSSGCPRLVVVVRPDIEMGGAAF